MKFIKAVQFAVEGIVAVSSHSNFQRQCVIGMLAILGGILYGFSPIEWAILTLVIGLVLCAEIGNSAIEEVVNLLTREHRLEAKLAKDFGAGMVLLSAFTSIIVGLFLFVPHLLLR